MNRIEPRTLLAFAAIAAAIAGSMGTTYEDEALFFACLVPSVIMHEVAHGVVANFFGDDTAKRAGRLSLDPTRHVDPFGTIILPALMILTVGSAFGWAKPVPVNVGRLRSPRNHAVLVSLAGIAVNLSIAFAAALYLKSMGDIPRNRLTEAVFLLGASNVLLGAFNLLPVPPLDGSALVERVLPSAWWPGWLKFRQYSMPLVFVLVLVFPGALQRGVFDPALNAYFDFIFT